ncbi:MAG: MATE family efflux transporter [Bacteroidales bacterium]|nr:MATE family efflux transporter [Bacteroidales bacterium]
MTKNSLKLELRKLVVPLMVETLLVMMLGLTDTIMLGQYSDNAVAAVGMVNQILSLVLLLFTIISIGTSVLCSQYLGAGRRTRMIQVTGVSLLLNLVLGLGMSGLLYVAAHPILSFMGMRDELMQYGLVYLQIVGGFVFTQAITNTVSASLRAENKVVYPMLVIAITNLLNILGNYTLIFGHFGCPSLGVMGAGISTSISRVVAMLVILIIMQRKHISSFPMRLFRPFPFKELRNLLKIGLPSAGENISYNLQQLTLLYFINYISNEALATRTYVVNVVMFVYMFAICMANGGSIVIGHLVGQQRYRAAFVTGRYVWRWAAMVSVVFSFVCALCGPWIMNALTDNEEIIRLGCIVLWIDLLLEAGKSINIYATNALRATGDVMFPFYLGVIAQWGLGVFLGWLFGIYFGWGLIGMWFAFVLDEDIRGAIFIARWNSMKWAHKGFC